MVNLKEQGYEIQTVYVTTPDPEINIRCVQDRVRQGGHDVPLGGIMRKLLEKFELLNIGDYTFSEEIGGGNMSSSAIYISENGDKQIMKFMNILVFLSYIQVW